MSVSEADAAYVRNLVRAQSAIQLDEAKAYLIEMRLAALAREEGLTTVGELVAHARQGRGGVDQKIVEAMSTYETSFFRDLHPFTALRREILPRLVEARAATRTLKIWCAACSSGQEPYSIAMLLREDFPELALWNVRLIATDHSTQILERAKSGRYSQLEVNRGLPAALLVKYFTKIGAQWEIRPELRKLVEFRQMNLISAFNLPCTFDVVFLRNVLIYFDVPTKRAILERVRSHIAADGSLFLGAAETTFNIDPEWDRVSTSVAPFYRRRSPCK